MTQRLQIAIVVALFMGTAAAVVSPVLATPFSGDDAFNSYLDGWRLAHHASLWNVFAAEFGEWDVGRGRFIPILQVINVLQFHFFHQAPALKALQVIVISGDVGLLFAAAYEMSGAIRTASAACVIAISTLEVKSWYDPIAQYNLHLPLATAFALGAILFTSRALRTRSRRELWFAVGAFALATLSYEIFAPLIVPIAIAIFRSPLLGRARLRAFAPFSAILAIEGCAVLLIRHAVPQPAGSAYAPTVARDAFLPTAWWQLTGALSFSLHPGGSAIHLPQSRLVVCPIHDRRHTGRALCGNGYLVDVRAAFVWSGIVARRDKPVDRGRYLGAVREPRSFFKTGARSAYASGSRLVWQPPEPRTDRYRWLRTDRR